jgi:hypothetical protein
MPLGNDLNEKKGFGDTLLSQQFVNFGFSVSEGFRSEKLS